jgi:hypothetical protein
VVISPNMKENGKREIDQWIPWEISYSLKEHTRNGKISKTNAILAIVLPDKNNSYDYYIKENICEKCDCNIFWIDTLFQILKENMFNAKKLNYSNCDGNHLYETYLDDHSYVQSVKWNVFKNFPIYYIDKAIEINNKISDYNIVKTVR